MSDISLEANKVIVAYGMSALKPRRNPGDALRSRVQHLSGTLSQLRVLFFSQFTVRILIVSRLQTVLIGPLFISMVAVGDGAFIGPRYGLQQITLIHVSVYLMLFPASAFPHKYMYMCTRMQTHHNTTLHVYTLMHVQQACNIS
jgi:hypothetical protein